MRNSRILALIGGLVLLGDQSGLASAAVQHRYHAVRVDGGTSGSKVYNPLADRAATLSGKVFTVETAEGIAHGTSDAASDAANARRAGNPLADRAATLGGRTFTAERAEGTTYQASNAASNAATDQVVGNPLSDRAQTLGGKTFTVEREPSNAQTFLARFR